MVEVNLWSGLRALADGQDRVEVDASTVGEVLSGLVAAYPGLKDAIDAGVLTLEDDGLRARVDESRAALAKARGEA